MPAPGGSWTEERQPSDELPFDDEPQKPTRAAALNADARKRVMAVRNGLRALLTLLSQPRSSKGRLATTPTPAAAADDGAAPAGTSRKTTTKRRKAAS